MSAEEEGQRPEYSPWPEVHSKICGSLGLGGFIIFTMGAIHLSSGNSHSNTQIPSSPFKSISTYNSSVINITTNFQDQPTYRGTIGIITTCLTTLGLCVWTALHLNIPERELGENTEREVDRKTWHTGWRKIEKTIARLHWVLLGIFIPELVAFTAWTQYLSARSVNKEILQIFGQGDESIVSSKDVKSPNGVSVDDHGGTPTIIKNGSPRGVDEEIGLEHPQPGLSPLLRRHKWTKVHSFYVLMGGFAFDLRGESSFIPGSSYQTLGPEGVLLLAKAGLLPDISEQDIRDKSKTDGLGQFIACCQAIWLIIQCIGRLKLGLFITTLELNTVGHVICALVTFTLWWNKPFQVQEPTLIYGKTAREICAYMWMTSSTSSVALKIHDSYPELESVEFRPEYNLVPTEGHEQPDQTSTAIISGCKDEFDLPAGQQLPGSNFFVSNNSKRFHEITYTIKQFGLRPEEVRKVRGRDRALPKIIHFRPLDAERWRLASAAMANPVYKSLLPYQDTKESRQFIVKKPKDITEGSKITSDFSWRECAAFAPVAGAYAGVHALAWNSIFATAAERTIWRLSVLYLSIVFVFLLVYGTYSAIRERLRGTEVVPREDRKGWHKFIVEIVISCSLYFFTFGYVFARVYLVVESFIGLRYMPPDAYLVPQWSQVIPHL